ncbi:MAG: hypothetical protein HQL26_04240 [Candidatus Omnitrophica bacterium]|nr:hypothetical protein [Candidatus Omnitrophota bacterium]
MKSNKATVMIVAGAIIFMLLLVNHWVSRQMKDALNVPRVGHSIPVQKSSEPKADPKFDDAAPVSSEAQPKVLPRKHGHIKRPFPVVSEEKSDAPRGPILVQ